MQKLYWVCQCTFVRSRCLLSGVKPCFCRMLPQWWKHQMSTTTAGQSTLSCCLHLNRWSRLGFSAVGSLLVVVDVVLVGIPMHACWHPHACLETIHRFASIPILQAVRIWDLSNSPMGLLALGLFWWPKSLRLLNHSCHWESTEEAWYIILSFLLRPCSLRVMTALTRHLP